MKRFSFHIYLCARTARLCTKHDWGTDFIISIVNHANALSYFPCTVEAILTPVHELMKSDPECKKAAADVKAAIKKMQKKK